MHIYKITLIKTTFDKADLNTHYNVALISNSKIIKISKSINVFFFVIYIRKKELHILSYVYKILIT